MSSRNPNVVRAHQQLEFTAEQIKEIQKCSTDPIYFIEKYIKIQHPKKGSVPFKLYKYQKELIQNFENHQFNIVLSARQTGKTTTVGSYLLWFAIFNFDKTVLIVSNKNSNAMEIINRIRYAYENLPNWIKPGILDDGWNKHSVGFDNSSRILSEATTEQSGRGLSISLLFCDEFAHVKQNIQAEFWTAIEPTLATGGNCIISSTPNGDTNLFAQLWRQAESGVGEFHSRWVKWDEPPGRDERFKEREIANIGHDKWRQEFECEFLSSDALLISSIILNGFNKQVSLPDENEKGFRFFSNLKKGKTYLIGVDPATGTGKDFSTIEVVEFASATSFNQVAEWRSNTMDTHFLYLSLKWILRRMEIIGARAYFSVENNGVGEGVIALYHADEEPPKLAEFVSEQGKNRLGMSTQGKTKMRACVNFKQLLEKGKIGIFSEAMLKELKYFVRRDGTYKAQIGATDDLVSSFLIITRLLEEIATYEQEAYDALYLLNEEGFFGEEEEYDEKDVPLPISMGSGSFGNFGQTRGGFTNPNDPESFDPFMGFEG